MYKAPTCALLCTDTYVYTQITCVVSSGLFCCCFHLVLFFDTLIHISLELSHTLSSSSSPTETSALATPVPLWYVFIHTELKIACVRVLGGVIYYSMGNLFFN